MIIILHDHRPRSLNDFYGRSHRYKRAGWTKEIHLLMMATLRDQHEDIVTFDGLVDIEVTAYFDKYPHDPDNFPIKPYLDSLVKERVLINDTLKYISSVTLKARIDKANPRVEIQLTRTE